MKPMRVDPVEQARAIVYACFERELGLPSLGTAVLVVTMPTHSASPAEQPAHRSPALRPERTDASGIAERPAAMRFIALLVLLSFASVTTSVCLLVARLR